MTCLQCLRAGFLAILLFMTSSCLIGPSTVYLPSAEGGRVTPALCPPDQNVLLLKRKGVTVSLRLYTPWKDELPIDFGLEIPEGVTVVVVDPNLSLIEGGKAPVKMPLHVRGDALAPGAVLEGGTSGRGFFKDTTLHGTTRDRFFRTGAVFPIPEAATFSLRLPVLEVNGEEIALPKVEVIWETKTAIHPLNC